MPDRKLYFALALVGVLVLGFIATSVIGYYVAHDSLDRRISTETLPLTSSNVYSEIERDLLRSVLIASLMAHDTFLRDWTLEGETEPVRVLRYLQQIQRKYDTTTAFFVSEDTRRYYHPDGALTRIERDDPRDEWYFRVRSMDEPYEVNVDRDTADPGRLTIFVNYRVLDEEGKYLGATGIGHSLESVGQLIESYENRYDRRIFFMDREGRITLHGESLGGVEYVREHPGLDQVATRILSGNDTTTRYTDSDGRTVHVNSRLIPEFDWYLVVEQQGSAADRRVLNTLALNIGIALVIAALVLVTAWFTIRGYHVRLEDMATRDELSGAASRQVFQSLFDQVVRIGRRTGSPLALIALDIDGFKTINDRNGHAAGDAILRGVADEIDGHLRESDTLCRWGGDEFLILLGDCASDGAAAVAERIRAGIAGRRFHHGGREFAVTVSLGVAEHSHGEDLSALVGRADAALYRSKDAGRDHVTVATAPAGGG